MVSPALCPTLTLLLIIGSVFTISLTENLQLADGLTQVHTGLIYELDVGESQILQWGMINNDKENQLKIQFYAIGPGSELMHFEEFAILEPGEFRQFDFIVVVPEDHPDNVEYIIELNALDRGTPLPDGETGIQAMAQMQQHPRILIGENPVYTYVVPPTIEITNEEIIITPNTGLAAGEGTATGETLEEKLARIAAANVKKEMIDVEPETQMEEIEVDVEPGYIAEPEADPEPTEFEEEMPACGFWEMILSWFGIKSNCI